MEEFKIIKGFSKYEISNNGNVKNIKTGRILKATLGTRGYYDVIIKNDEGKLIHITNHKLVGLTFIPNPNNYKIIDHIDNNKLNNDVNNLRWCSQQQNNFNQSLSSKNTSGFKGVYYCKSNKKWNANIKYDRKTYQLGSFDKKEDAINARIKEAKKRFGDFINSCEKTPKEKELEELEELDKELTRLLN